MSLRDEKAAALAEVLAATGEPIAWKGRTLEALVSDPLSQDLGLGGFSAKGDCTMKVLRSELGADRPKLGETAAFIRGTFFGAFGGMFFPKTQPPSCDPRRECSGRGAGRRWGGVEGGVRRSFNPPQCAKKTHDKT